MKMKKLTAYLLAAITIFTLTLSMTGCSSNNGSANSTAGSSSASSQKPVKIGVILYNYTDIQGKEIKSYASYLEQNFNVKFEYATVGQSEDQHISGLENLLNKGVDAVISGYDTALDNSIKMCEERGVYYGVALGDIQSSYKGNSKYFVGGLKQFNGDPEKFGETYAEIANQKGLKHIGVISFPAFTFVDGTKIADGFKKKMSQLDPSAEVYDMETFMYTPDLAKAAVTNVFTKHSNVDSILGLGSGMDMIYPAIKDSTKPSTKILSLGYNDSTMAAIKDGSVVAAGTNNYSQIMANMFAQLYDRVNGKTYSDWSLNGTVSYPIVTNEQEVADFQNYVIPADKSKGSVTAEELKKVMKTFNSNATWKDLNALTNRSLAEIKAARKAQ
ncbi:sugar ABC transporter substrate-binding protein [Caproicibacter sp.]|uniref:sugar ABC transporter substrate-binding protein n=1 Tax=Caproicibacter sp. TaxID=2814884 RepID=UPI00398A16B0